MQSSKARLTIRYIICGIKIENQLLETNPLEKLEKEAENGDRAEKDKEGFGILRMGKRSLLPGKMPDVRE